MLALAQWVLKGQTQAAVFILLTIATSPFISINAIAGAAAIALVWLRKGTNDGLLAAMAGLLPAAVLAYTHGTYSLLLIIINSCLGSYLLRSTMNWRLTLLGLAVLSLLSAVILEHLAAANLQQYVAFYDQIMTELKQQATPNNQELVKLLPEKLEVSYIAGLFGILIMAGCTFSLLIARSLQAKLFNPGGFQQEFHALRLSKGDILAAFIGCGVLYKLSGGYLVWVWIPLFPLIISGIALFHFMAGQRKLAVQWYIVFYLVLIFWNPLKLVMVMLATMDGFSNIRQRIRHSSTE